ncbi:MAG TPA: GWxTD domain-containing protein [Bacteroidia bacterium]|nr:GWxTD domain-containing protein [Bacteroidia bacterium]
MKKIFLLFLVSFSLSQLHAREITANLTWSVFSVPEGKTYVETYLSVIGNSIVYQKNKKGKYQASVDVLMTFTSADSIRAAKRYVLNSPEIDDTTKPVNFLDLQRIPLSNGYYSMMITLTDLNRNPKRAITNWRDVMVDIEPDSVALSHIELLESYVPSTTTSQLSKSGYDLVPYVSSFYPENLNALQFYGEIYNTPKHLKPAEKFIVFYYLESAATHVRMSDFNAFVKLTPQPVNSILYGFNIATLPTGSYNLVVEVRNAANRLLAIRKTTIERFNPGITHQLDDIGSVDISNTFAGRITNADTLKEYIRSLRPISTSAEAEFAENRIKAGDVRLMQQYLYNFWLTRNEQQPEGEWLVYRAEVIKVNAEFGTQILKGYETDRGRVYLQYGPPDQRVTVANEPSSYPYEIWQYYTIRGRKYATGVNQPENTTQTNKKFVFADFDLVTNNYELIHSDARGEVRDDSWKIRLTKRDRSNPNLDNTKPSPQYGGNSDDWYVNPH